MASRRAKALGLGAAALMIVTGAAAVDLTAQEQFTWSGSVDAADWLSIQNISGDVEVTVVGGSSVEVVATKRGDSEDFDLVRVEVVEDRDGVSICTIYPSRRGGDTQDCGNDEFERERRRGNVDVEVHFEVRVPSSTQLRGTTVNGDVIVDGTLARAVATTVNGDVEVASRGSLTATTVNGSVDARIEGAELDGPVELTTVNGSIHLDLDDDVNADIDAKWVSGGLRTDLPLAVRGRMTRSARGQLGNGGERVRLATVNGRIEIR